MANSADKRGILYPGYVRNALQITAAEGATGTTTVQGETIGNRPYGLQATKHVTVQATPSTSAGARTQMYSPVND